MPGPAAAGRAPAATRFAGRSHYEEVYNCLVEDWHTYYVGNTQWGLFVWAHNGPPCLRIGRRPKHGGDEHNLAMIGEAIRVLGTGIKRRMLRTNQVLVGAAGDVLSRLRPDVQWIGKNGRIYISEINISGGCNPPPAPRSSLSDNDLRRRQLARRTLLA